MVAFVKKEADGKYHIVPTVSPENWGCTVDFRLNKDCIMDLALTEFLLDATVEASKILGLDAGERPQWAGSARQPRALSESRRAVRRGLGWMC